MCVMLGNRQTEDMIDYSLLANNEIEWKIWKAALTECIISIKLNPKNFTFTFCQP